MTLYHLGTSVRHATGRFIEGNGYLLRGTSNRNFYCGTPTYGSVDRRLVLAMLPWMHSQKKGYASMAS
jgi:hypothetical protein